MPPDEKPADSPAEDDLLMSSGQVPWWRPMRGRETDEKHRAVTPLELLFDLCFVVAIAQAAGSLHHAIAAHHYVDGVIGFLQMFFVLWWAWMNFTWFASAYDPGDQIFKLLGLVQIIGALVLAAGVPRIYDGHDTLLVVVGYSVMRASLIVCWLRASREDTDRGRRGAARRYAVGITFCQLVWLALLVVPAPWSYAVWLVAVPMELAVPAWAERVSPTNWHPYHIVERYSLMTLIVIGESVLSATLSIQAAVDVVDVDVQLVAMIAGAILVLFGSWWLYFAQNHHHVERTREKSFAWGYGHYFIFGALAATGGGIAVTSDALVKDHGSAAVGNAAVAIPIALFLTMLYVLCARPAGRPLGLAYALSVAAVLGSIAVPLPILPAGGVLLVLAIVTERVPDHAP